MPCACGLGGDARQKHPEAFPKNKPKRKGIWSRQLRRVRPASVASRRRSGTWPSAPSWESRSSPTIWPARSCPIPLRWAHFHRTRSLRRPTAASRSSSNCCPHAGLAAFALLLPINGVDPADPGAGGRLLPPGRHGLHPGGRVVHRRQGELRAPGRADRRGSPADRLRRHGGGAGGGRARLRWCRRFRRWAPTA